MSMNGGYRAAASAYAEGVRALFAPAGGAGPAERGGPGGAGPAELADRADALSERSATLLAEARAAVSGGGAEAARASTDLLAKAVADLTVAHRLFEAAEDERAGIAPDAAGPPERGGGGAPLEDVLAILEGGAPAARGAERGAARFGSAAAARRGLGDGVEDALVLITDRASKTGKDALGKLLGAAGGELLDAAAVVGGGIAEVLGLKEGLGRLLALARSFVVSAYDSLVALFGLELVDAAAKKVVEYLDEYKEADRVAEILRRLYGTDATTAALRATCDASTAAVDKFEAAAARLDALREEFSEQLKLIDRLLKLAGYGDGMLKALVPNANLALGAVYLLALAYVVFAGADYVDAPGVVFIDRVEGVRRTVESALA